MFVTISLTWENECPSSSIYRVSIISSHYLPVQIKEENFDTSPYFVRSYATVLARVARGISNPFVELMDNMFIE